MVHWLGCFSLATTFKTEHFAFYVAGLPSQIDLGNRSLQRLSRTIETSIYQRIAFFYIIEIKIEKRNRSLSRNSVGPLTRRAAFPH